ncbi:MAG: HAMP domain-containing sensor histidine kinase, partial [Bacteroidota bacterium]
PGICQAYGSLGVELFKQGKLKEARANIDSAYQISQATKLFDAKWGIFRMYSLFSAYDGDLNMAFQWSDSLVTARDSLHSQNLAELQSEADARFQVSKKDAELVQKELDLARSRNTRNQLLVGALSALFLTGLVFMAVRARLRKHRREAELAAKQEKEEAEKLRELDQLKTNFFTNISHEFRTPLTLLLSPLREMQRGSFKGDHQRYYRMMERNGQRLETLINQLLDLARLEGGKMSMDWQSGNLLHFLRLNAMSFESWADRKEISYTINVPNQELKAAFDPDKLGKVLDNLLSNAFKYTPEEGRVTFSVDLISRKEKNLSNVTQDLLITVADTGIGIPEKQIPYIFDRFTTGNQKVGLVSFGNGLLIV